MVTRFRKNNCLYSFYIWDRENGHGFKEFITIVKTPDDPNEAEIIKNVPVNERAGYAIKINKKSISAGNGARGVFSFIADCIKNDFMMTYVYKIIKAFT